MPRRAAVITQADVARAIRAAKQAGAGAVEVLPGGKIVVLLERRKAEESTEEAAAPLDGGQEIVL